MSEFVDSLAEMVLGDEFDLIDDYKERYFEKNDSAQ